MTRVFQIARAVTTYFRRVLAGHRPGVITSADPVDVNVQLTMAEVADMKAILSLIEEARQWLTTKETDRWRMPWPTEKARDARLGRGLQVGRTWVVRDADIPVATVTTATPGNSALWVEAAREYDLSEQAAYTHRLITARKYASHDLGVQLIDWAGLRRRGGHEAKRIRIDVWTSNLALHEYYRNAGFAPCARRPDAGYPSGVLLEKPVSAISAPRRTRSSGFSVNPAPVSARAVARRSPRKPRPQAEWPGQLGPERTRRAAFSDRSRWYVSLRREAAQPRQRTRRRMS